MVGLDRLRVHAISQSLFPQTTLKAAIRRLGFVQADPIRSPARAQDLILRHRVKAYRAGDLEWRYAPQRTGSALWEGTRHQRVGRLLQGNDACIGPLALSRSSQDCAARKWNSGL